MTRQIARWMAAFALLAAAPATSQGPAGLTFGGTLFDVTGAGTLDLGDIDSVLEPFAREFQQGRQQLRAEVTVDRDGIVVDCRTKAAPAMAEAGEALCAYALKVGRFRQSPKLVLDYTKATYEFTISMVREKPTNGSSRFRMQTGFPMNMIAIRFNSDPVPPEEERLRITDLATAPMVYPPDAVRSDIEARVMVAVTFGADGRLATCRPIISTNTPRMAYETCRAAQEGFRLVNPPDERPFYWITTWKLED